MTLLVSCRAIFADNEVQSQTKPSTDGARSTPPSILPQEQKNGEKHFGITPAAQSAASREGHRHAFLHTLDLNLLESEREIEHKKISSSIRKLFGQHDWKGLDELAAKLFLRKTAFSLGVEPIGLFFTTFDKLSNEAEKSDWNTYLTQLKDFANTCPQSETPGLLIGRAHIDHAWHARGSGPSNTVSANKAQLFRDRLKEADQVYKEQQEKFAGKNNEIYYSSYAKIALGEGWPRAKCDDLFNEAFAKYPNSTALYIRRAIYLLPRWYGKSGECLKDLDLHCDKLPEADGDVMYARVCTALFRDKYFSKDFCLELGADWNRIKRGFSELENRYPNDLELLSLEASMATEQKDNAFALEAFKKLGPRVDISYWRKKRIFSNAYTRAKLEQIDFSLAPQESKMLQD